MSQSSVISMIYSLYDDFYPQEKKVANYVIAHAHDVVNMNNSELAKACETSVATISRFVKKCGVESFHQFKVVLARDVVLGEDVQVSSTISLEDVHTSIANIQANKMNEIKATLSLLDEKQLKEVVALLSKAAMIQIVAVGNTIPVAINAQYMFNEIGLRAMAGTIWETQLAFSMTLTPQDVMIAISNTGESKDVVKMIHNAREGGAKVIAITNNPQSTIASLADYHLQSATREKLFLNEFYFSRVSAMTIIEVLYLFLTVGNEKSYDYLSKCENLMADEKL